MHDPPGHWTPNAWTKRAESDGVVTTSLNDYNSIFRENRLAGPTGVESSGGECLLRRFAGIVFLRVTLCLLGRKWYLFARGTPSDRGLRRRAAVDLHALKRPSKYILLYYYIMCRLRTRRQFDLNKRARVFVHARSTVARSQFET